MSTEMMVGMAAFSFDPAHGLAEYEIRNLL